MSLGLLLQLVSVLVLRVGLGRGLLRRTGPYFVIAAVSYHGLTELLQQVTGEPGNLRYLVPSDVVDDWTVVVGVSLVAFSVAYVVVTRRGKGPAAVGEAEFMVARRDLLRVFDWRVLLCLSVPLIVVVAAGEYRPGAQGAGAVAETSAVVGLTGDFLVLMVVLTTISFIGQGGRYRFAPALLLQMIVLALVGQRSFVVFAAITTVFGLSLLGFRPRRPQVISAILLVLLLALSINTARGLVGRDASVRSTSLAQRIQFIGAGTLALIKGDQLPYAATAQQPLADRLDGNSFPAAVLGALQEGGKPVGLATTKNNALLAVPSFVNPTKLLTDVTARSEKRYLSKAYGIPTPDDFLPTQLGVAVSYFGPYGLPFVAGLLGTGFGVVDRRFLGRITPLGLLVPLGALTCALGYEHSMEIYPLTARAVGVLVVITVIVHRLRRPPTTAPVELPSLGRG